MSARWCAYASVLGSVLVSIASPWPACAGGQVYQYRGAQAPQVKANPLADELEQELQQLQAQLKARSIETSLAHAIEQSLLRNPELALSYSQIQQAEWTLIAVRRQWYPSLRAASSPAGVWSYGRERTRSSTTTFPRFPAVGTTMSVGVDDDTNQLGGILAISWTFFDPTRDANVGAASEALRSQQLLFNVAARNLVLETQLDYFNLQERQQLIASYEEILSATALQVRQVEALYNAGTASIADVEQIRAQRYQTLGLLVDAYRGLVEAAAALASAMALPAGQLVLPSERLEGFGRWELSLEASIRQARELREEIRASLAQARAAGWRASALFNQYWPQFSLGLNGSYTASAGWSHPVGAGILSRRESYVLDTAVGVSFNWAIFDGGIAAAQAQSQAALARQYADQAALDRLAVTQEVETSYAAYDASRLALLASREQLASARLAAIAVRERYNVGYSSMTDVVSTLNSAILAANAFAQSQKQYNSAVASLYRASAQWPGITQGLVDLRVTHLKKR